MGIHINFTGSSHGQTFLTWPQATLKFGQLVFVILWFCTLQIFSGSYSETQGNSAVFIGNTRKFYRFKSWSKLFLTWPQAKFKSGWSSFETDSPLKSILQIVHFGFTDTYMKLSFLWNKIQILSNLLLHYILIMTRNTYIVPTQL